MNCLTQLSIPVTCLLCYVLSDHLPGRYCLCTGSPLDLWLHLMGFLDAGRQLYKIALFPAASDLKSFFTRSLVRYDNAHGWGTGIGRQ